MIFWKLWYLANSLVMCRLKIYLFDMQSFIYLLGSDTWFQFQPTELLVLLTESIIKLVIFWIWYHFIPMPLTNVLIMSSLNQAVQLFISIHVDDDTFLNLRLYRLYRSRFWGLRWILTIYTCSSIWFQPIILIWHYEHRIIDTLVYALCSMLILSLTQIL